MEYDMPDEYRTWNQPGAIIKTVATNKYGVVESFRPPNTGASGTLIRTWFQTPGFSEAKRTGTLPENYFRHQEESITQSLGTEELYDTVSPENPSVIISRGSLGYSQPFVQPFLISPVQFNQRNIVLAKIASKIKDMDVDLSVVAGELRETRAMFVSVAQAVARAVGLARKGRFRDAAAALGLSPRAQNAANGWLLLNYGVMPLIADLRGSLKALEKGLLKERYCLVHARDVYSDRVTEHLGNYTHKWEIHSEVSARVKYRVVSPYTSTLASLGLTNPLTTGWELTKLSFVVDWLIGVGGWLGQVDAYFGKVFVSGSVTRFTRLTCAGRYVFMLEAPGIFYRALVERGYTQVSTARDPMTSFNIAVLPGFRDPLSLSHVATATSLLVQLRSR